MCSTETKATEDENAAGVRAAPHVFYKQVLRRLESLLMAHESCTKACQRARRVSISSQK